MKRTYIATTQEAKALHDGTQTAIITKMRVQPPAYGCRISGNKCIIEEPNGSIHGWYNIPYAIGQEVVVREAWIKLTPNHIIDSQFVYKSQMCQESEEIRQEYISIGYPYTWNSPATMPVSAARTRFIPVSCEAVRVRDVTADMILPILSLKSIYNRNIVNLLSDFHKYATGKLGQSAWDNNDYVFYYKIDKI